MPEISYSSAPVLVPRSGSAWADTMVLNPAIVAEPGSSRLHMLFRATGPWPKKRQADRPLPYPIFLGYAFSDDGGRSWKADFSRPALSPALGDRPEEIYIQNTAGNKIINHANGCIEDPRLTWLGGQLYMTTACRMFPPGPYWLNDEPTQCAPGWARTGDHSLGRAGRENLTVTVLWKVDLKKLAASKYEEAFQYVAPLTDPELGDNRDTFLFPEKIALNGKSQYLCVHRPMKPEAYGAPADVRQPTIYFAAADRLEDLGSPKARHHLLAAPSFKWEQNRVGGSFPPIRISDSQWLLPYHGKQDGNVGYTQSFMILREQISGFPTIIHRCSQRLIYAHQPWELSGRLRMPCIFSCGGVVVGDELVISYGAGDTFVGIARVHFQKLVEHVRKFDAFGRHVTTDRKQPARL